MAVQVKICGIASVEAADAALRAGADYAGLVFRKGSPRYVVQEQAAQLAARMRGRLSVVALLSNSNDEEAAAAVSAARPDFLQLHGSESPARVAALRTRFGTPIIKAIAVADATDMDCVTGYESVAELLLFDAKAPPGSSREGGHGAPFDWQLLHGRAFRRPWLLGGGLTAKNVGRAIGASGAAGVDVSSGVERSPGVKDATLIAEFVRAARAGEFATEAHA